MFTAVVVAVSIAALVAFAAGVVFHKYVISEAASIKAHVTTEVTSTEQKIVSEFESVRADLQAAVEKFAQKL